MREIRYEAIVQLVRDLCIQANTRLPQDLCQAIRQAGEKEEAPVGRAILGKKVGERVHIQVNETYGYDVVVRGIEKAADDGSIPLNSF